MISSGLRLAVLASGRGSNLQAIFDAIGAGRLDAQVVAVFSDRPQALALQRARECGVPAIALSAKGFATRVEFDEQLFSQIDAVHPDLIVCAGYMRLISDTVVAARAGRMINIHPSLLPAFKGLHTHEQALAAGATEHGASVHFVTPELDGGPVIAQVRVPILPDDDAQHLGARVLGREHPLLVACLQSFGQGRIELKNNQLHVDGRPAAPLQLAQDDRLVEGTHA